MKRGNMYSASAAQWNPFVGCRFGCTYCRKSFQAQMKRQRKRCEKCYRYEPHCHPERLNAKLPRTGFGQFIFACAAGDIAWCDYSFLQKIHAVIKANSGKTFLMQSKDPYVFSCLDQLPNLIIGTTAETNRPTPHISAAPWPRTRLHRLSVSTHKRKMVTVEPVMDFDLEPFAEMILAVEPCLVWIGYDTKATGLPEPQLQKVKELAWRLSAAGVAVQMKKARAG